MLRKILPLALVVAVGAFTYSGASMDVNNVGAQEFAVQQADVASGFLCGVLVDFTTQSHAVLSPSGKESLSCSSDSAFPPPPQTVILRDLGCNLFFGGATFNSQLVINSNEANLWCKA